MEMEQLIELIEITPEIARLIFKIAIFLLPILLVIWYLYSRVKDWWKMVKKE